MKELILITLMGLGSAHAGIGGISGGHVNFQRESTFVHPMHNKTLCFDGVDYHAKLNKCVKERNGDSGGCERYEKVDAVQPKESLSKRCVSGGDRNHCTKWEMVPFIQYPNRVLDIYNNDRFVKRVKFKIKSCQ